MPGRPRALADEAASLERLAALAERLDITIAIENLAPVFPGPEKLSAIPASLRSLVAQLRSPAVRICLDLGHANVTAGLRRTDLRKLVDPVLDSVALFHLHDNFGARRAPNEGGATIDPLRLDLHLPPGRGSLEWEAIAPQLLTHEAPLMLEVHPPHRPSPAELVRLAATALRGEHEPAVVL